MTHVTSALENDSVLIGSVDQEGHNLDTRLFILILMNIYFDILLLFSRD